jgi:hypothetical protein
MRTTVWPMLAACAGCAVAGCVDDRVDGLPVELLVFEGVDPDDGSGRYALRPVELAHLTSPGELADGVFRFFDRPELGEIAIADVDAAIARTPLYAPRLAARGELAIPRDTESLLVLSTYHGLRTVYDHAEQTSGRPLAELTPARGFPVMVHPVLQSGIVSTRLSANAFYVDEGAFFGIPDSDAIEQIPVTSSLPVLAHEFGHHLFATTGLEPDPARGPLDPPDEVRGLNEGFADFHAFALTGVTNPLADVFAGRAHDRNLDPDRGAFLAFTYATIGQCLGQFYCIGTLFARSLHDAFRAEGGDREDPAQRAAYARDVLAGLTAIAGAVDERDRLGSLLGGFVAAMPAGRRPALCDALTAHFGAGFTGSAAGACP